MSFTISELKKLKKAGKIQGIKVPAKAKKAAKVKAPPKPSREKTWLAHNLAFWAVMHKLKIEPEVKFSQERDFRFDYAFRALKVGIEYEGIFSGKSRHTTIAGFSEDCIKYNLAATEGWTVLRYTAKNYKEVIYDLNKIYKRKNQL